MIRIGFDGEFRVVGIESSAYSVRAFELQLTTHLINVLSRKCTNLNAKKRKHRSSLKLPYASVFAVVVSKHQNLQSQEVCPVAIFLFAMYFFDFQEGYTF
jgi:hypothetical protein